jgi:hypothetical protein
MRASMFDLDSTSLTLNADRDVVGQIKLAFANPLPLLIGALIGALVPIATYTVGHAELEASGWGSVPGAIVVGGCVFSAITVYKWGRRAFDSALKALGFVVLSEGVMTFSHTPWLSMLMLGFLMAINAVANGANLAVAHLDAVRLRALEAPAPPMTVAQPVAISAVLASAPGPVVSEAAPAVVQSSEAPIALAVKKPARKRASRVKVVRAAGTARAERALN